MVLSWKIILKNFEVNIILVGASVLLGCERVKSSIDEAMMVERKPNSAFSARSLTSITIAMAFQCWAWTWAVTGSFVPTPAIFPYNILLPYSVKSVSFEGFKHNIDDYDSCNMIPYIVNPDIRNFWSIIRSGMLRFRREDIRYLSEFPHFRWLSSHDLLVKNEVVVKWNCH